MAQEPQGDPLTYRGQKLFLDRVQAIRAQKLRRGRVEALMRHESTNPEKIAAAEQMREGQEGVNIWDTKDMLFGVGRGFNNFARSTTDLAGSLFGLTPAKSLGWEAKRGDSILGGFSEGGVQFVLGYASSIYGGKGILKGLGKFRKTPPGKKADLSKGTKAGKANRRWLAEAGRALKHGGVSDFIAFHPDQGNFATYLKDLGEKKNWEQTKPGLWNWMKQSTLDLAKLYGESGIAIDTKEWAEKERGVTDQIKGRLKNVGEGMALGLGAEGFVRLFKTGVLNNQIRSLNKQLKESVLELDALKSTKTLDRKWGKRAREYDEEIVTKRTEATARIFALRDELANALVKADKDEIHVREDLAQLKAIDNSFAAIGKGAGKVDVKEVDVDWDKALEPLSGEEEGLFPHTTSEAVIGSLKGEPQVGETVRHLNAKGTSIGGGTVVKFIPDKEGKITKVQIRTSKGLKTIAISRIRKSTRNERSADKLIEEDLKGMVDAKGKPVKPGLDLKFLEPEEGAAKGDATVSDKMVWEAFTEIIPEKDLKELLSSPEKVQAFQAVFHRARKALGTEVGKETVETEVKALQETLARIKWASPTRWGGEVHSVNFLERLEPSERGLLYEIGADGKSILMDEAAIAKDWEDGGKFLLGTREDPLLGIATTASSEELEIFYRLGVDPRKFIAALRAKSYVGRIAPQAEIAGAKLYQQFLELRARHIVKYAEKKGIPLNTLNIYDPATREIFTRATYDAMFNPANKGGLNMGAARVKKGFKRDAFLKSDTAMLITPSGNNVDFSAVQRTLFKEHEGVDTGIKKLVTLFKEAGSSSVKGKALLKSLSSGDLWAWHTAGTDLDSNAVMVAMSNVFESQFNSHYAKPDGSVSLEKLATSKGWNAAKSKVSARKFISDNLDEVIDALTEGLPAETKLDIMTAISQGKGGFAEGKLRKIDWHPDKTHDLSGKDLSDLAARVMSMRVRINGRSKLLGEAGTNLLKKMTNKTATTADKVDFARAVTQQLYDLHSLSSARTAAGRTLRAFQDFDKMLKNPEAMRPDEIIFMQEELIRGFGGEEGLVDSAEALLAAQKEYKLGLPGDATEIAIKEAQDLLANTNKMDFVSAVNDIWINALLSGLRTHAINNTSSGIKAIISNMSRITASYLPESFFKGKVDPVDAQEISASIARSLARDQSTKQLMFTFSFAYDTIRAILRGGDEAFLTGKGPLRQSQQQQAHDAAAFISGADVSPESALGGAGQLQELIQPGGVPPAMSKKLQAGVERTLYDEVGEGAFHRARQLGDNKAVRAIKTVWDGFYTHVIRQAMRKMVAGDQFFKRVSMMANMDATLWAHASNNPKLKLTDPDAIAQWVVDHKKGLVLSDGNIFTRDNLNTLILKEGREKGYKGLELQNYLKSQMEANWDLKGPNGKTLMKGEQREMLAARALDDANELVFQRHLDADAEELHGIAQDKWEKAGGVAQSEVPKPTRLQQTFAQDVHVRATRNPMFRVFVPFVKTPFNLWKDAYVMFPLIGKHSQKYKAAVASGDALRAADAYGRQMVGTSLVAGAMGLVWSGRITGAGPHDPRERENMEATGWRKWSVRLPGGNHWEYGRLEPYGTLFKIAADAKETMDRLQGDPKQSAIIEDGLQSVMSSIGYTMVDSTYMKSAMEMLTFLENMASKDADDYADNAKFIEKRLASFVPNILEAPGGSYDDKMREARDFWDAVKLRAFPYGLPPQRDPIFGNEIKRNQRYDFYGYGNPRLHAITPAKSRKTKSISFIYEELVSLGTFKGAPSIYLGPAASGIMMTRHHAEMAESAYDVNRDGKVDSKEQARAAARTSKLREGAKLFTAPGGAACPIEPGQDFYDFYQQYMNARKVEWNPADIRHWAQDLPDTIDAETKETIGKLFDKMSKELHTKVGLEEILLTFIASPAYQAIPVEVNEEIGKVSYRREILSAIIDKWRTDSRNELFGELEDINKEGAVVGVAGYPNGIARVYWPNLAIMRSYKNDMLLQWRQKKLEDQSVFQSRANKDILEGMRQPGDFGLKFPGGEKKIDQ